MRDGANVPDESSVSLMGAELGAAMPRTEYEIQAFCALESRKKNRINQINFSTRTWDRMKDCH